MGTLSKMYMVNIEKIAVVALVAYILVAVFGVLYVLSCWTKMRRLCCQWCICKKQRSPSPTVRSAQDVEKGITPSSEAETKLLRTATSLNTTTTSQSSRDPEDMWTTCVENMPFVSIVPFDLAQAMDPTVGRVSPEGKKRVTFKTPNCVNAIVVGISDPGFNPSQ